MVPDSVSYHNFDELCFNMAQAAGSSQFVLKKETPMMTTGGYIK